MDRADHRYSRFVATLKVLLPLAALVLLSTLFLLARVPESGVTGRIMGDIAADGRMNTSTFTAMTEDGPLTVSADVAIPRASNYAVVDLEGLQAELDVTGQRKITVSSDAGRMSRPDREAAFEGNVQIATSDGYLMETEVLQTAFDGAWARSPGPIRLSGPDFTLEADTMSMTEGPNNTVAGRMLFNGGVRLVYTPQPVPGRSESPK